MKGGKADVAVRGFGQAALNVWILIPRIEKPNGLLAGFVQGLVGGKESGGAGCTRPPARPRRSPRQIGRDHPRSGEI